MSKYEFRKPKYEHEELRADIEANVGRLPTRYEVSYDEEGNIAEVTLTFDPPLTDTEETKLKKIFAKLGLTKMEMTVREE